VSSGNAPSSPHGAQAVEVAAQAKINLRLRILAKETNGYHQLETLFLRIDLADTIRIRRTSGGRSLDVVGVFEPALIGAVEKNLAWQAAEMYVAATEMRGGFAIELEKRIPIGGGLGGGSADAGAVLRALSAMDDEPMAPEVLLSLAATLGADVPFLTIDHAYALAWGRGERMLALAPPPPRDALLVVPSFSVNTAEAFGWHDAIAATHAPGRQMDVTVLQPGDLSDWTALSSLHMNDFESAVEQHHPELLGHREFLQAHGYPVVMMSGSGSTVFGIWTSPNSGVPGENAPSEPPAGAKLIRTRTSARVEQVFAIE
jgi:4-diphosphocytidyl-2-C-methyl-D-erythritol kinase